MSETTQPAVGGQVERRVRRRDGERLQMELYETLTVSVHTGGIVRVCGNGGMIFEAQGKYVKTETFVERTEQAASGAVKQSNKAPSNV